VVILGERHRPPAGIGATDADFTLNPESPPYTL
jgi:hypothetical protein